MLAADRASVLEDKLATEKKYHSHLEASVDRHRKALQMAEHELNFQLTAEPIDIDRRAREIVLSEHRYVPETWSSSTDTTVQDLGVTHEGLWKLRTIILRRVHQVIRDTLNPL